MDEFIKKLIVALEEVEKHCLDMHNWQGQSAIVEAKEIITQLAEEYSNGWIPCSERLPEKYGEYLCCDKYGEYIIGYPMARITSDDYYVETEHEIMNDCIKWQPLPPIFNRDSENPNNSAEKPKTNYDRIKAMSVEEFGEALSIIADDRFYSTGEAVRWLKSDAEI